MKTVELQRLILVFCRILVILMFCIFGASAVSQVEHDNSKSPQAHSANTNNAQSDAKELYKTIIDKNSGFYAFVGSNKDVVTLKNTTGNTIWSTNVITGLGPVVASIPGHEDSHKIHNLALMNGKIYAGIGRGYAIIDAKTGKLFGFRSN